jgi:hypothetical protein
MTLQRAPRLFLFPMPLLDYVDRALRDAALTPADRSVLVRQGLQDADTRLQDAPDDAEALALKGLLLRLLAGLEPDAGARAHHLAEADRLRERSIGARRRRLAGLGEVQDS